MKTWKAYLVVATFERGWEKNDSRLTHSYGNTEFKAENIEEAMKKFLLWVKKRLSRFKPGKLRSVSAYTAPVLENGNLDGKNMLRNRHSRSTIPSILHGGVNNVLVQGFGPRAAEECARRK